MVVLFVPPWDQVGKFSELFGCYAISSYVSALHGAPIRPRQTGHDSAQTTRMGDMAAMAARYETLQEDEVIVPSSKGHTDASAAAMMKKWGKNEIPEEKEPLWRMFAMQFVGTMPAMVRMRPAPPTTHRVAMPHTARCPASTVVLCTSFRGSCNR